MATLSQPDITVTIVNPEALPAAEARFHAKCSGRCDSTNCPRKNAQRKAAA